MSEVSKMNIAPWSAAFKSLGEDWIKIVTGSIAAIAILVISFLPVGQSHPLISVVLFFLIWSWTWAWAFVRSWNREHRKVFILAREFALPELWQIKNSAGTAIVFNSEDAELDFYSKRLSVESRGIDKKLLKELIAVMHAHQSPTEIAMKQMGESRFRGRF
jgi:hypothetical protein